MIKRISLLLVLLTGCSQSLSPLTLVVENGYVDLAQQVPGDWDRVCILTPYTTDKQAVKLTGLDHSQIAGTGIMSSDEFHVLVFLNAQSLYELYQVNRKNVEFNLTAPWCFSKEQSYLVVN
jgi:hypothetical protein